MPFVKFRVVRGNALEQCNGFFIAFVLVARQADQQLKIARLGDDTILPARVGEILELFWLFLFLHLCRVPRRHDINQITGNPARSFELLGESVSFRIESVEKQTLILYVYQAVQQRLKNIGEYSAATSLGNHPSRKLIRSGVNMIDFNPGKTLLERGKNRLRVDLRERSVKVECAPFGYGFFIEFIDRLPSALAHQREQHHSDS